MCGNVEMNASHRAEAWETVAAMHKQDTHMLMPNHTQIYDLHVYFLSIHNKQHLNESDLPEKNHAILMPFNASFYI